MSIDIDKRLEGALHRIAAAHVPEATPESITKEDRHRSGAIVVAAAALIVAVGLAVIAMRNGDDPATGTLPPTQPPEASVLRSTSTDNVSTPAELVPVTRPFDGTGTNVEALIGPLSFEVGGEYPATVWAAQQLVIQRCMQAAGFAYEQAPFVSASPTTAELEAVSNWQTANDSYAAAHAGFNAALDGSDTACTARGITQVLGDPTHRGQVLAGVLENEHLVEFTNQSYGDPRFSALLAPFAACLTEAGYNVDSPVIDPAIGIEQVDNAVDTILEAADTIDPIDATEYETGADLVREVNQRVEAVCDGYTELRAVRNNLRNEIADAWLAAHPEEYAPIRDQYLEELATAQAILND
jgi:hypothetical protein